MKKVLNDKIRRQGDVLLVQVDALPADAAKEVTEGNVVIAHGEVTGHKHQFMFRDAEMYRSGGAQVLKVLREAGLKHEEHTEIKFPPGIYDRPIQVEHSDDMEPRIVAD